MTAFRLKQMSANPVMIAAYRSGLPAAGKAFPDGSKIVKIEWAPTANPESPYAVQVPGALKSISFIMKDSKRFPQSAGWGYALFNYDPATDKFSADAASLSDCGHACHTAVKAKDYIFHPYQKR